MGFCLAVLLRPRDPGRWPKGSLVISGLRQVAGRTVSEASCFELRGKRKEWVWGQLSWDQ